MEIKEYAPIVLFTYNRPEHTRRTIEALKKNIGAQQSRLFIYSDYPKNEKARAGVEKTREYIHSVSGFAEVSIIERTENWGLARSIISGTTELVNKYGTIIVMEDDLVSSPYFLQYMNEALLRYQEEKKVFSITGYSHFPNGNIKLPESYFLKVFSSWSWATWADRWEKFDALATGWEKVKTDEALSYQFDYEGRQYNSKMLLDQMEYHTIDSWAIRAYWTQFTNDMITLFPNKRLVDNEGFDGTGVHCNTVGDYLLGTLADKQVSEFPQVLEELPESRRQLQKQLDAKTRAYKRLRIKHYLCHPKEGVEKVIEKVKGKLR